MIALFIQAAQAATETHPWQVGAVIGGVGFLVITILERVFKFVTQATSLGKPKVDTYMEIHNRFNSVELILRSQNELQKEYARIHKDNVTVLASIDKNLAVMNERLESLRRGE